MGTWQEIDHTADLALRLQAQDLPDLFTTAARGMFSLIVELDAICITREVEIALEGLDIETLLVDWLNELLYLSEVEGVALLEFEFTRLSPFVLRAVARGGKITEYLSYVKAATFHNLQVSQTAQGYATEIVFDT